MTDWVENQDWYISLEEAEIDNTNATILVNYLNTQTSTEEIQEINNKQTIQELKTSINYIGNSDLVNYKNFTVAWIAIEYNSEIDFLEKTLTLLWALKWAKMDNEWCIYKHDIQTNTIQQYEDRFEPPTQRTIDIDDVGLTADTAAELVDYLNTQAGRKEDDNLEIAESPQEQYEAYIYEQIDKADWWYVVIEKIPDDINLWFLNGLNISKLHVIDSEWMSEENIQLFLDNLPKEKIINLSLTDVTYDYSTFQRLEILKLDYYTRNMLPKLPDSLKLLQVNQSSITEITQLPLGLTQLDVSGAQALTNIEWNYPSLKTLSISKLEKKVDLSWLKADNLEELILKDNQRLENLDNLPNNVTHLDISWCENLTDISKLDVLVNTGWEGYFRNLKILDLTWTQVDWVEIWEAIIQTLESKYAAQDLQIIQA